MTVPCIPYKTTQTLPKLLQEVMGQNPHLDVFYTAAATLENFGYQIKAKSNNFSNEKRQILVEAVQKQYKHINPDLSISAQIESLKNNNTFTVTTGHQLNLMGGPLYFLYKIISVINLAKTLKEKYSKYNFVPVFWMASEDHDFDEINHFYFGKDRLEWAHEVSGAVGRLSTEGLAPIFKEFKHKLYDTPYAESLEQCFQNAYLSNTNLADATRSLVHQLFGADGLIAIDGDDVQLKSLFTSVVKSELKNKLVFKEVTNTNKALQKIDNGFKIQVNPRPLNLFYLKNNSRARIEEYDGIFRVLNTDLSWDLAEILEELKQHPERFSPNVLMRPLYQETILPNLCYIGGGGELSYWLQLKSCFDSFGIIYPLLMHRCSAIIGTEKQLQKLKKENLSIEDLFFSPEVLSTKVAKSQSSLIDFSSQKNHLKKQFEALHSLAKQTDASFEGAVAAQEKKQRKGLDNLEKRLLRAEKRKHKAQIEKALSLQSALFPNGNLQERVLNFSTFYALYGDDFVNKLKSELDPFQQGFAVISL